MIVTVTPNPSLDRTLRIPPLVRGEVMRATESASEAGGKGINVARALAAEGRDTVAVAPLSRASEARFSELLGGPLRLDAVPIDGDVRVNVGLVEADGTVTKVNEPGPTLSAREAEALLARTVELAVAAEWVAGCGSLPPGVRADFYAEMARRVAPGVRVAVDTDGAPLAACLGAPITLLKPNRSELERLVGRSLRRLGDVVSAAAGLTRDGVGAVLVSLGPDGAVLVDGATAMHAEATVEDVANTVGAGDALLAGFLAGGAGAAGLATGVAWSAAACRSPGSVMRPVRPEDRALVRVHDEVDSSRMLVA